MGPVNFEEHNFNEPVYKKQFLQSTSKDSWEHLSNGVFDPKKKSEYTSILNINFYINNFFICNYSNYHFRF